jgi:hypothetical protein
MAKPINIALEVTVSAGWSGLIAAIVEILNRGTRDGRIPARPVIQYITNRALSDSIFLAAVARQDRQAAANRLYKIGLSIIQGGVKPVNAPSTAARKGGDRRALRNTRGKDRVYKMFTTTPKPK